ENKQTIKDILLRASKEIRNIAKGVLEEAEQKEWQRVSQVVSGALNQSPKKPDEGEAIKQLALNQGLRDFEIIADNISWVQLFNKYRNQVIHESYLSKEYPY